MGNQEVCRYVAPGLGRGEVDDDSDLEGENVGGFLFAVVVLDIENFLNV